MNSVWLIGNLTKDPELSQTNSNISVCKFGLAVNRKYASSDGNRETDFFNIVAWRGTAENITKYCKKGHKVSIKGTLQTRSYEDKEKNKRSVIEVVVEEIEFLTQKAQGGGTAVQESSGQQSEDEGLPF